MENRCVKTKLERIRLEKIKDPTKKGAESWYRTWTCHFEGRRELSQYCFRNSPPREPRRLNKQLLDEVEHDIMNYQSRGLCYLPKPKAEADNTDTRV